MRESQSDAGIAAYLARHDIEAKVRHEIAEDIDVGNLLLSRAADLSCDLIVMSTHGRGGLSRLVFGSVAEDVVRHAPCPVLILRPA